MSSLHTDLSPEIKRACELEEVRAALLAYRESGNPRNLHNLRTELVKAGVPARRITTKAIKALCRSRRWANAENAGYQGEHDGLAKRWT